MSAALAAFEFPNLNRWQSCSWVWHCLSISARYKASLIRMIIHERFCEGKVYQRIMIRFVLFGKVWAMSKPYCVELKDMSKFIEAVARYSVHHFHRKSLGCKLNNHLFRLNIGTCVLVGFYVFLGLMTWPRRKLIRFFVVVLNCVPVFRPTCSFFSLSPSSFPFFITLRKMVENEGWRMRVAIKEKKTWAAREIWTCAHSLKILY